MNPAEATARAVLRPAAGEVERLLRQREAVLRVVEEISSELELRPLLTRIAHHACELLGARDAAIGLYDEARDVMRTEAVCRMPAAELGAEMAPGRGLAGQVLVARAPVRCERYGDLPGAHLPELAENAVLGVPISWRGRLVGFFGVGAAPPHRFDDDAVDTLTLLARHAGIAIENTRRYAEELRRTERFALIARIGHRIAADLKLDELLQTAADAIHAQLRYPCVDIPLLDADDPTTLVVRFSGGLYRRSGAAEERLPVDDGIMGAAVRERRPQLVSDARRDRRYVRAPGQPAAAAELAIPILLGDVVLGVLNVEGDAPFDAVDVESLQILADHLAAAIGNARLFERSQRAAVLEERQRLARDLHDSVTQLLTSISMLAQSLAAVWHRDPERAERRTERLAQIARTALAEMRAMLRELRPPESAALVKSEEILLAGIVVLRRFGLQAALQRLAVGGPPEGPRVRLDSRGWTRQETELEETLFRIAQEALSNAFRHARARLVSLTLTAGEGALTLAVADDGVGFDLAARRAASATEGPGFEGLGLGSMRQRLEALGGSLRIETAPGAGTRVEAWLPLRRT
jgi:two-component system, NarL family, sensor kinase